MSGDFIDSNVFIYLFDEQSTEKRDTARNLVRNAVNRKTAQISFQVVQETLNVLTAKVDSRADVDEARAFLEASLLPLWTIMPSEGMYLRTLELRRRYGYSFYDSLIIAAAVEGRCTRLYSEDLQDGQQIDGLTIVNPFK